MLDVVSFLKVVLIIEIDVASILICAKLLDVALILKIVHMLDILWIFKVV